VPSADLQGIGDEVELKLAENAAPCGRAYIWVRGQIGTSGTRALPGL